MALIPVFILWSSLHIVSISGNHYFKLDSSSSGMSSDFSVSTSDLSADFSASFLEKRFPSQLHYFDLKSLWAKSLYDDYEVNYSLKSEANACSKSYSLSLNTTIRLQAVSSSDCTIKINTSLKSASWFGIEIQRRDGNPNYSAFFVKNILEENSNTAADIISFPFSDCKVKLFGKSLIFRLVMTYIDINISNLGNLSTTQEQKNCSVKYDGLEWYHHKWYPFVKRDKFVIGLWSRQLIKIRANMFHILCPKGCNCSLGHNQWLKNCQADVFKILLVCNPNIVSLSLSKRRLSKIDSEAFLCYVSLRKLILRKNYIQTLPKQTFEVLEKLTFLDVSYNQLMFLPSGIFEYQLELEYLKLNNNFLSSLPSEVFHFLNRLAYLELGFNLFQIPFESSIFSELQNLAYLDLKNANIQLLLNTTFSFSSYLKNLDLRHNDISTLNSNIFDNLTKLKDMNLGHNKLTRIRNDVFNLTGDLRRLLLDHNFLTFLPAEVFINLARLEHLVLSNNILSDMPRHLHLAPNSFRSPKYLFGGHNKVSEGETDYFKLPPTLKSLSLNQNEVSTLRAGVFANLTNLKNLNVSHNLLNSLLEDIFTGLKSLLHLDLSNNFFTELPYFKVMSELKTLRLERIKVSSIYQKLFNDLDDLRKLNLSLNRISIIPSGIFSKLKNLIDLDLAFNEITHIFIDSFPSEIAFLNLQNNRLSTMPHDILNGLKKLGKLFLNNNRLVALPDFSSANALLQDLRLSHNRLTIYPDSLRGWKYIHFLRLQNNEFVHFPKTSFQSTQISYLDISSNKLNYFQNGLLDKCLRLRILIAGDNKIRELPLGIFDSLPLVIKLSLKFNKLTTLHDTVFHSMQSLQHLYLEGNNLVTLPVNIFRFNDKLRQLTLSWNNFFVIFPETFETLAKLEVLELEGTNLENVSNGCFDSLVKLKTLLMSDNNIVYLFESMYNMTTKLIILDLCCNNISSLPMKIFTPLISLKFLNLANNSLSQLPSLASCSELVYLELNNNVLSHLSFYSFQNLSNLKMLTMQNNNVSFIPRHTLETLKILRVFVLNSNFITSLDEGIFKNLGSLQILRLSNNWISNISDYSFIDLQNLITLELQYNNFTYVSQDLFQNLTNLIFVNISQNYIHNVHLGGMTSYTLQITVDLRGNMLRLLTPGSFPNFEITFIVDRYSACCFMTGNVTCISLSVRSEYLTCQRMLRSVMLRLTMWFVGLASVTFNIGVICSRLFVGMKSTMQTVLILNLAVSDFLMGIDMLILSSADFYYHNMFPSFSASWIKTPTCKIAATLSTLSSEASVILVALISLDRYLGIRYPLGVHKGLGKTRTRICVFLCWLISMIISLIPVIVDTYVPGFYDISEVCVGLPIVKRKMTVEKDAFIPLKTFAIEPEYHYIMNNGSGSYHMFNVGKYWRLESVSVIQDTYYKISAVSGFKVASVLSIIVFVGFNLTCFIALPVFYIRVFQIASGSSKTVQSTAKSQEIRMAVKMSVVVLTDFFCWVPLALVCLFVQCGAFTVGPEFYSWTVGLILPINSCLNPFLYTVAVILQNRRTKKSTPQFNCK